MTRLRLLRKSAEMMVFKTATNTVFSFPCDEALVLEFCNKILAGLSVPNGNVPITAVDECLLDPPKKHFEENKDTYDKIRAEHNPKLKDEVETGLGESEFINPVTELVVGAGSRIRLLDPYVLGLSSLDYERGDVVTLEKPIGRSLVRTEGEGWVIDGNQFLLNDELMNPMLCAILSGRLPK